MASAESQRQMVVPETSATTPCSMAVWRISSTDKREKGTPRVEGSSQAKALISTLTLGGKNRRSAPAREFLQPGQAVLEEALTPLTDHLPPHEEAVGDLVVAQAFGRHEDDPSAHHIPIRQRILRRPLLQDPSFFPAEFNDIRASSGHGTPFPWQEDTMIGSEFTCTYLWRGVLEVSTVPPVLDIHALDLVEYELGLPYCSRTKNLDPLCSNYEREVNVLGTAGMISKDDNR